MLIPIIISGGSGSRLWPLSRQFDPKPFIKLASGNSLLQNTFLRAINPNDVHRVLTVTNKKIHFRMHDEYRQISQACNKNIICDFILEPVGRNTAPAILSACMYLNNQLNYNPDDILLILPADHLITNYDEFKQLVVKATSIAQKGYLVTFGIKPSYPETGYGYIEANCSQIIESGFLIKRFVEKPNLETAKIYLDSGDYLWNSGMFLGRIDTFLNEFKTNAQKLYDDVLNCVTHSNVLHSSMGCTSHKPLGDDNSCVTLPHGKFDNNQFENTVNLDEELFNRVENISIDYAIFEKSVKTAVIPCHINWSDIGSWLSVADSLSSDANNNVVVGEGGVLNNTHNCFIYSDIQDKKDNHKIIATSDVKDLIIVDTKDALLVADKNNSQNVRYIFDYLKTIDHAVSKYHKTIHYAWGKLTELDCNAKYIINKIKIKAHNHFTVEDVQTQSINTQITKCSFLVLEGRVSINDNCKILEFMESYNITMTNKNLKYILINNEDTDCVLLEIKHIKL